MAGGVGAGLNFLAQVDVSVRPFFHSIKFLQAIVLSGLKLQN